MAEIISDNIYLIMLLPFWIFLIIMLGRFFSVYVNKGMIYLLTLFASGFGGLSTLWLYKLYTPEMVYESTVPFIKLNDFVISCGIHIDRMSLIFTSVLFIIGFFVQLFSISYMKDEKKQYRFFALLNLFNFIMAGLFFSPNLYQTYVFWELAGLVSYLLISFDYFKSEKSLASKKVFIINRIGDTAFISAIIMCSYLMYEYAPSKSLATLSFFDMNTISTLVSVYSSHFLFIVVCGLFILAAAVKSAQAPFYTWLQDAMEAKLPVSSLLHSATLVALGIYLLIRMMPFFTFLPSSLRVIAWIGVITAFVCSLCACSQKHSKKVLAYSTSAQLGLIFFALGILNIKAAVALFCAHAFTKSMLFLTLPDENEKWNYPKFILFIIGGLSLSGTILAGLPAKEMLAHNLGKNGMTVCAILSFLTAFYITRLAFVIIKENGLKKIFSKKLEIISAIGLMVINIILAVYLLKFGTNNLCLPFWTALAGLMLTVVLCLKNAFVQVPYIYPLCFNGLYLDKLYTNGVVKIYDGFTNLLGNFDTKILSNYTPVIFTAKLVRDLVFWIETNVMEGMVSMTVKLAKKLSEIDLKCQSGNIQRYNLYGFIIITIIITCLVIAYTAVLTYIKGVG